MQYDDDKFKAGEEQFQGLVQFEGESWSGQVQMFTENGNDFYVYSQGNARVPVEWKVFGESVAPVIS